MQVGQVKYGMQTMNQSLFALFARRLITYEEAIGRSNDADELRQMIESKAQGGPVPGQAGAR
jgi:twitching motility protein PilT